MIWGFEVGIWSERERERERVTERERKNTVRPSVTLNIGPE